MSDFSKNMLDQFSDSPGLEKLKSNLNIYGEAVKDAKDKNYSPQFVDELKENLKDSIINEYESFRESELLKLNEETEALEKEYNKKMVLSPEARRDVEILEKNYAGLSDDEVEQKYKDYLGYKISDPHEHEVLSRQLRERKSPNFENFRKHYKERRDDKPYQKLNPELYEYKQNLQDLKRGEFLIYLKGKNSRGQDVKFSQYHNINDIIDN